ncbi:TPA: hypothetical protein QIC26_002131 [Klebsiella aerogenes]|uniref:hypothetical protein n=1 Tax=Klebsiella aerogenes TaxID=548 RepID=UPI00278679C9|nr:hypothetical protein [Klebsiella aerogenes]MEB5738581.1 hypothetical protein [Klebsiella aerogenes]HDT0776053.1 hypothetical protein [Klebsiella aerogenes]
MYIPRNKRVLTGVSLCLLAGGILFSLGGYFARKAATAEKSCRSDYVISLDTATNPVASEGVFYLFTEKNGLLILSVNGKLTTEQGTYNIARRIVYAMKRTPRGNTQEVQSTFLRSEKYPGDNAPDRIVDQRLFGTLKKNGTRYKVEQLTPDTLVIGSYFSPLYVCQFDS